MGLNLPTLALAKKYTDLKTSVTDKQINAAVNQYLENNPVSPGASPEESAQIGANKQNITTLQNEIVMRSPAIITEAIGTGKVRMDDSSSNPFIGMGIKGRSGQVVTTGAQLLDLSAVSKSAGGAVVNYGDGGYTISGTGTLTVAFSASYQLDYLKNQLKPGNLILKSELTIPKMYIRIWDGNTVLAEMQGNSTKQITQEMLDNDNIRIECFLYGTAGSTITPGTYHPMLYQSGDGTWEPYTGGQPSPSPEYPQPIISTGTVTTGAQLFDASKLVLNNAEAEISESGRIIKAIGKSSVSSTLSYKFDIKQIAGKTVYLQGDQVSKGDGVIQMQLMIKAADGKYRYATSNPVTAKDIVVSAAIATDDTGVELLLYCNKKSDDDNVAIYENVRVGIAKSAWEPYTGGKPSPSPDYPQPLDVTVAGANLLNTDMLTRQIVNAATGMAYPSTTYIASDYIPNIPGQQYRLSTTDNQYLDQIVAYDINKNAIINGGAHPTPDGLFKVSVNAAYMRIRFYNNGDDFPVAILLNAKPMLNAGPTALPYQPYQSRTASITLTEPLRGIDDHNDMITMTKRIDRCVEMTFDGRENWAAISTYEGFYYAGILPFSAMRRAGLCNQFPVDTKGDAIESVRIGNGNSVLFCVHSRFYDDAASDKGLSAWKAHLASHPLKVVTYLDTPVETDLDADTIAALAELTTYKGHTTVSVAAGGPEPDITMEYIADTKTYIANEHAKMQAEFDKQIAAILALLPAETQAAMINNETSALLAESEV